MKSRICLYSNPFPYVNSYYKMIDTAVEFGLNAVEAFSGDEFAIPDEEVAKKLRAYADERNVIFPCFSSYANLVGEDARAVIERMKGFARIAAILGSPYLHHTIAPNFSSATEGLQDPEGRFQRGVEAVREIYDYAQTLGVKAIYEDQGFVFNGVAGFDRFLREVDRDVGVVIDFGNIYQGDDSIDDFVTAFVDRAVHAHLKDAIYDVPESTPGAIPTRGGKNIFLGRIGEGKVDFAKNIRAMENAGYTGYYGLEFNAGPGGKQAWSDYIAQVNKWIEG